MTAVTIIINILTMLIAVGSMIIARNCYLRTLRVTKAVTATSRGAVTNLPCDTVALTDRNGDAPVRCSLRQGHIGPHLILPAHVVEAGFVRPPF